MVSQYTVTAFQEYLILCYNVCAGEKNRGLVSTNEDLEARLVTERDKNMSLLAITQKLESEMRGNIERMPHDATTPEYALCVHVQEV